jgi:serine/threonine protein kinase/tetratricopeptide (TPR) repeat protein
MSDGKSDLPLNPTSKSTPLSVRGDSFPEISLDGKPGYAELVSSPSHFAETALLAGRFKVIRFVARGGMGEVYEAEDLELKERVAIKTIRFELGNRERAIERFIREIQLARKVTDPNVCRTFDVFRHIETTRDGGPKETLFVSMELLSGDTLERRIRRVGRFTPAEAAPIVGQLAAGLHAAHQAGVVHRDFKSANVILVPSENGPGGVRAVITDFGLAHAENLEGNSLTGSNDLVGTPAYMAPEQLEGGEITPATDVYALGVVLFEMLTGVLPFTADTPLATALKRLTERAPSPRAIVPDLDVRWDQTVRRCLERAPLDRFSSTDELLNALHEGYSPRSMRLLGKRRILIVSMIIVLAIGIATSIGIHYHFRKDHAGSSKGADQPNRKLRPSVAVLGFENFSGDEHLDGLGNELTENLGSQLDTDEIERISPARVDEMKESMGLRKLSDALKPETLKRIHDFLGCDYVITGSISAEGEPANQTIQWNIHMESASGAQSFGTIPKTLVKSDRFGVVKDAGRLVREKLGIELAPSDEHGIAAAMPTNAEASKYYTEGLAKMVAFDPLSAAKSLQQAVKSEPGFALAHSALAETWSLLGYDMRAQEEAQKALDLSSGLPNVTKGLIEARYYETSHQWEKAITKYSELWDVFHAPEYALLLAKNQIAGGKARDALTTLDQLRATKPPIGIQAQIDLQEANAQEDLANYQDQLKAAIAAGEKAKNLHAEALLARARTSQCIALVNLGTLDQAKSLCDEVKNLNQDVGDRFGTANAVNAIGNAYERQGDFEQALPLYEQALRISRSLGDKVDEAGALTNLGNLHVAQGDLGAARKAYQESIDVARDHGNPAGLALAETNLAAVLNAQGYQAKAKDLWGRSMKLAKEIGAKDTEARVLNNLCMLFFDAGDLTEALQTCNASLQLRQELGHRPDIARSQVSTGDIFLAQGSLADARQNYEQALSIQKDLQENSEAAYTQVALARLALEDGRVADARSLAESAAAILSTEKDKSDEAEARAVLAEALLDLGNIIDSRAQFDLASKLADEAGDPGLKIKVAIVGAMIDAQSGQIDRSLKTLESARKSAHASGLIGTEFEATLMLGETEIKNGRAATGRPLLQVLAKEAKAKGFNAIATKAARNN